ncbi:unnamed protein product [Tuber aestivum]|uniref:DUF726 domain protein n=1 Tax=Tuber aestivum TaxID=59557 RepID=A0A292PUP7_9PEZI|nr:unnamed protein product [Tuber aestivum]
MGTEAEYDEFGLPVAKLKISTPPPSAQLAEEEREKEKVGGPRAEEVKPTGSEQEKSAVPTDADSTMSSTASAPASRNIATGVTPPLVPEETASKTGLANEAAAAMVVKDQVARPSADIPQADREWNEKKMFSEDPADPSSTVGTGGPVSEWSHQQIVRREEEKGKDRGGAEEEDDGWQEMPAFASHDLYDDEGRLIAKEVQDSEDEGEKSASKGYTRVYDDEDARSATSMDENTSYLFRETEDDEASRNPLSQMQATKELLTEGQRIAYVGVCKLAMEQMVTDQGKLEGKGRAAKKELQLARENMKMWSQKMMVRLYMHMDISSAEQIMIEQLAEHGVIPADLTPTLTENARVENPIASSASLRSSVAPPSHPSPLSNPPPYKAADDNDGDTHSAVKDPTEISNSKTLDIDIRWTVLCDLFLVLIADSVYDARSRVLLERVGEMLGVPWLDIYKFEKRVTDALEIQESAQQNWNEEEHMENRRKAARNKRFMMMGLATIGGGLVIGLSGGLLAPVIGAGLAAGFTTIGVGGTGAFLAGAGGTALIASSAVASGSAIGAKASYNRTKSVGIFEFRPLHNAKRVNLIITVSGWMNGIEDDVRLPYSTVDPIMGDIFSILWEPEMLRSMGQTINILATERAASDIPQVLTQSLQQVLGSTILVALMASLQLPVVLTKLSYLLDNPWSVSLDRANAAGLILADSLINRNLGVRPVTLVGYSLGARMIYSCLRELQRHHAYGLVQNVYLFGSPVVVKQDEYRKALSVVSGRFVNGFARNDWILGYLFRATSGGIGRVAGLAPVDNIAGVENVDLTELVNGHMAYRQAIPRLLRHVGWIVVSDEFTEIQDPDPDRHRERQRELIEELEGARKEIEKNQKKPRFSFFGRGKDAAKKKDWETYDEVKPAGSPGMEKGWVDPNDPNAGTKDDNVIFDVDAIRAELARVGRDEIQPRELNSTLPPLRANSSLLNSPMHADLRHTKSFDHHPSPSYGMSSVSENNASLPSLQNGYHQPSPSSLGNKKNRIYISDSEDEFGNPRTGEIQMTFDASPLPSAPPRGSSTFCGPEVRTSVTMPTTAGERNVWADDDDDFGEEGEMTMTFA